MTINDHKLEIVQSMDGLDRMQLEHVQDYIQRLARRKGKDFIVKKSMALREIDLALSGQAFAI